MSSSSDINRLEAHVRLSACMHASCVAPYLVHLQPVVLAAATAGSHVQHTRDSCWQRERDTCACVKPWVCSAAY
jgi:hypothetical protein